MDDLSLLYALAVFAFVGSVTPGPNNMMLMASGANFGIRRTIPHLLGVSVGHSFQVFCVGVGLAGIFDVLPWAEPTLKAICLVYLFWLAWRIAQAASPDGSRGKGRPMTFFEAAAFQWVNPKAWALSLTAVSTYAPGDSIGAMAAVALTFSTVNLPSVGIWTWLGQAIRRWLDGPGRLRAFNWTMAILLVASTIPVLF
ncbi:MAG: LysE family translocator [Pseudomonadota bacterium]